MDQNNIEAIRQMADVAEAIGREEKNMEKRVQALVLRKRVAELQPGMNENHLDVARAALEVNDRRSAADDRRTAEEASANWTKPGKKSAAYHEVAAKLALLSGKGSQIEGMFPKPRRPGSGRTKPINCNSPLSNSGRRCRKFARALSQRSKNWRKSEVRRQALRTLLQTSFATGEMDKAIRVAKNGLKSGPEAQFEDQMLFLNLLGRLKPKREFLYVAQLQAGPPAHDKDLTTVLSWLNNHRLPAVARDWAKRLPEERRLRLPVVLAYAESLILSNSTDDLRVPLKLSKDWGDLEFQREALLAWLLRAKGDATSSRDHWARPFQAPARVALPGCALVCFATAWKWNDVYINLLWTIIAKGRENPQPALQILLRICRREQDAGTGRGFHTDAGIGSERTPPRRTTWPTRYCY